MAMQSPGCELSPSNTLMRIDRWPSCLVANRSVCRAGSGVLRGMSTMFFSAKRLGFDAFHAQAMGVDVGHVKRAARLARERATPLRQEVIGIQGRPASNGLVRIDGAIGLDAGQLLQHAGHHGHPRGAADQQDRCTSFHSKPATVNN